MKLFLDTEFVDLKPGCNLISIALVDENEEFFYAELTDTYMLSDCSPFVKQFVLPFLKGDPYKMTWIKCAKELKLWVEKRGVHCYIASDNPGWDTPYLKKMFEYIGWPSNLDNLICPVHVSQKVAESIIIEGSFDIHNALDDAMVMKRATIDK